MNKKIKFSIVNGVLYGPYPEGIELDLPFVKQLVKDRLEFLEGKTVPGIIDTSGIKQATKEAKDYFAKEESAAGLSAVALISNSAFSRVVSNFFIKISLIKTPIPIRLFSNEQEALEWLEQYK